MVTIGAAFISRPPQLSFDTPEWLTVLCAVLFAAHIVATDKVMTESSARGGLISLCLRLWLGCSCCTASPLDPCDFGAS